jgi:uncharacterized protein
LNDAQLIRFVRTPEGGVVADLAAKLPGRGVWVRAQAEAVAAAVKRNAFARGLKAQVKPPADLVEQIAVGLRRRALEQLGLGRKAGALALGMDQVLAALKAPRPPRLLIEAADGASDGRQKLFAVLKARSAPADIVGCFSAAELGMALGRDHVVHLTWLHDRMAQRWAAEIGRLSGFCALTPELWLPDLPRPADLIGSAVGGVPAPTTSEAIAEGVDATLNQDDAEPAGDDAGEL